MATYTHISSMFDGCSVNSLNNVSLDYKLWTSRNIGKIIRHSKDDFSEFYTGSYDYLYRFVTNEEVSTSIDSSIEFIPNQKLVSKHFEITEYSTFNIKVTGMAIKDTRLHFTLYRYNGTINDVPMLRESITLSDEFETFNIGGYAQPGTYYLYIRPEYATSANNKVNAMEFVLEDLSFESTEEEPHTYKTIAGYYMEDAPNTMWVSLYQDKYDKPVSVKRYLTNDEMLHPLNTNEANEITVPCRVEGDGLDIPEGFTTYLIDREKKTQYVRFLAKKKNKNDYGNLRVVVTRIDVPWSVGYQDATYEEILELTNPNELCIDTKGDIEDCTYELSHDKWTEISIDFYKDFGNGSNQDSMIYAISIGTGTEMQRGQHVSFLINNFRIYDFNDAKNGEFDPDFSDSEIGTYGEPYTEEHGRLFYNDDQSYFYFKSFSGVRPPKGRFLFINNRYYIVKDLVKGQLYANTAYTVDSDGNKVYLFDNAVMACNEYFIYDGSVVKAGYNGHISYPVNFVKVIVPQFETIDLLTGESFNFTATCVYSGEHTDKIIKLEATSTNTSILEITNVYNGEDNTEIFFTTHKQGICNIIIYYTNEDGYKVSTSVTVKILNDSEIAIFDIQLLNDYNVITKGEAIKLGVMECVMNPPDIAYVWESSNESVAIVDQNGLVYGESVGEATITVSSALLDKSSTATVRVRNASDMAPGKKIFLLDNKEDPEGVYNYVKDLGTIFNIRYRVSSITGDYWYADKTSQKAMWSSSNKNIATVDDYGVVTCLSEGTTEIVCSTIDGLNEVVSVKVSGESKNIQDITLNLTDTILNIAIEGDYKQLKATIVPEDTVQKGVTWSSSNPDIATVNQYGLVRPGILTGTAVITCTSTSDRDIFATCNVGVINEKDLKYLNIIPDTVRVVREIETRIQIDKTAGALVTYDIVDSFGDPISNSLYTISEIGEEYISLTINSSASYLNLRAYYIVDMFGTKAQIDYCSLIISDAPTPPRFTNALGDSYYEIFQNDVFMLGYELSKAEDTYNHYLRIDNGERIKLTPKIHYDNMRYYCYISNKIPYDGSHTIQVEVEYVGNVFITSGVLQLSSLSSIINKETLEYAKGQYDRIRDELIDYLYSMIQDDKIYDVEREQYEISYFKYNHAYANLYDILEKCIGLINDAIANEQSEMSALASEFVSNEVSTYSVGDYTNSNFENVTDMDYYQNECIKELVRRVLELEAIIQELNNKL